MESHYRNKLHPLSFKVITSGKNFMLSSKMKQKLER